MRNLALFLVLVFLFRTASAAEARIARGSHEVTGSSSMALVSVSGSTVFSFDAAYGYFATNFIEPRFGMAFVVGGDDDAEAFIPEVRFLYNDGWRVIPFGSLGAGVSSASLNGDRSTSLVIAPSVGILVSLNQHAGLTSSFTYRRFFDGGANVFVFSPVGLTLFFR